MNYVPTPDVIKRLNEATTGDWDFEIKERWETRNSAGTIIEVHLTGRLTCKEWILDEGRQHCYLKTISKEDIGGATVKFRKDHDNQSKKTEPDQKKEPQYLSLTSDWKAAASDLFKRCARQFGLGNHLWNKVEESEIEEESEAEDFEEEKQKPLPAKYQNLLLEAAEAVGVDINSIKDTARRRFDKKVIELSIPEAEKLIKQFNEITCSLT